MKKFLLLAFALLAGMGGVVKTNAQEIYAAMEPDGETMVLYYDDQRDSRGGLTDWGTWGDDVTRVVFDESFQAARPESTASWFDGFGGLREIENIDYLNTSEVTDMTFMFYGCSSLETLDVSGFDTHNVTSMNSMFANCSSLTALDVSGFQTENVTNMCGMFADCISLSALDVSGFQTGNVTDMSFMFWGCQNVEALDVRGFDTRNVTNMQGLFASCLLLSSLDVSGFNTDKVTDMGWMFLICSSLSTIDVSGFNTNNVTNMSGMFSYCSNVSTIDVSRFNTSKVTGMNTMFEGCSSLGTVAVSDFDTRNATDMHGMFSGCSSLTSLDVSRFDTRNVTDMHGMFSGCPLLTTLDVSGFRTDNVRDMSSMFQNCQQLTGLDLDGFRTNIVTDMSYMFQGCEALTELDLGGFNMDNLTNVQGMFDGCVSLRTIVCGADMSQNFNIADSEEMFSNCVQLQGGNGTVYDDAHTDFEYALPDGLNGNLGYFTQPAATEFYAVLEADGITLTFHYDNKITQRGGVTVWSGYADVVTKVVLAQSVSDYVPTSTNSWFANFTMLQDADLSNLNTSNVTDMGYMFAGCTMLESVDVSGFDVSLVTDMGSMFSGCSSLEHIYCDEDWSQNAGISVWEGMFENCLNLAGGNGTAYNGSHTGLDYALPDGQNGNPGYFTTSGVPELYAVLSTDGTTLTLYYDAQREKKGGVTDWSIYRNFVKRAVLHKSMTNAAPVSTARWFEEFGMLRQIEDLSYLNTSAVTDMTGMFYMCQMLESIDLSGFVTSSATSMRDMFYGCFAITSLDVSGFQTGNVTDMNGMFAGCVALASLDISNFDMQSVTDMGYMFSGCMSLVTFEAAGLNTASVEDLSWLFYNCASLETVNISGWSNDKAVRMSNMFTECAALETVNLSGFRTPSVVYMDSMFFECASLTGLDASSFDTHNVTDMNSMFAGCASLTGLDASSFDTRNVTDMKSMFLGCSSLATVNVSSFNTENTLYLDSMFLGCSSLTSLDLSNFHTNKAMDMSAMFLGCSSLATLDVRNFDTRNVTNMHKMFDGCSSLGMVDVRHFDTGKVTDMIAMFADCSSLTSLDVSGFNTRNVQRMSFMFLNCRLLDELDVSHFNTANAIEIGYMFADCSSLTTLDVSGFKTEKVTEMQGMFSGCSSLTSLDVSGFNTRMATDMHGMFSGCTSLTSLDVSGFNTERVRNMADMFKDCALTWLDVSRFNTENVTDMSYMFSGCASLTFLNVSGFNTDKVTDTEAMFGWCGSLETIYCGDDWSLNAGISNSVDMFYGSTKLKGGNGTTYNDSYVGLEYACQDGKYGKPGYFTQPVYFTVSFLDRSYISIESEPQQVPYGGTAIAPEAPEEECYDFTGWSRTFDHVVSDFIVFSQYSKITNSVMFLDFYGEQLGSIQFIECGGAATAPPVPEVEGYEFKGWDPANFTNVTENMWIYAQYEPVSSHVHNWGEPTYKWEGLDCTAKRVCADDAAHVETETVTATLTSTTEPTCTEKGANTYTAVFANGAFDSQTTTTEIPALGHDWTITYMWSEDHATCTATAVCKRDASHTVTEVSTAIATTEDGVTTYTAIFGNSVFEKQTFTETSAPSITVTMSEYGFLSFYADKAYAVPSDLKAYIYTGISGRDLTYQMLTVIPAYTGVFFDGTPNTTYTLYETTTTDDYSSVNMLSGTLADEVINDGNVHYILTRLEGTTQGGLYWPKGTVNGIGAFTNKAGKAYLSIPASAGVAPRYFTMRGQACEEVTAVDETEAEGDGKYYDILGREVREPQPQQIYIRNGQKVLYTGR